MDIDYAITFMSSDWIIANSLSLAYLILCLLIGKYSSKEFVKKFAIVFVYFFIIMYILFHYFHFVDGTWSLNKRLPLHLCGISSLITCVILFIDKKQFLFEFLFYAGILGGINALLTPLIDNYTGKNFYYFEYFYSHTSIIIFPLLGSKKPDRRFIRVLFPEPVLPTIPTHSPFFIENVIFFNDGSSEFG